MCCWISHQGGFGQRFDAHKQALQCRITVAFAQPGGKWFHHKRRQVKRGNLLFGRPGKELRRIGADFGGGTMCRRAAAEQRGGKFRRRRRQN
jgi:hypothetical protein